MTTHEKPLLKKAKITNNSAKTKRTPEKPDVTMSTFNFAEGDTEAPEEEENIGNTEDDILMAELADDTLMEALQFGNEEETSNEKAPAEKKEVFVPIQENTATENTATENLTSVSTGKRRKKKWIKVQKQSFKNGYLGNYLCNIVFYGMNIYMF